MTIPPERQNELTKLATDDEAVLAVLSLRTFRQPHKIMALGREILGLEADVDIASLTKPTQEELLFTMKALRDAVYEPCQLW